MTTGTNVPGLGGFNRNLILEHIRRASGGISRVDLAAANGLTRQAVSNIVRRLIDDGLVEEFAQAPSRGGKPATLLRINPSTCFAAGVHIDPQETVFVITDFNGRVVTQAVEPTSVAQDPDEAIAGIAATLDRLIADSDVPAERVLGVGVACPGPIDPQHGLVVTPPNLPGWTTVPLLQRLGDHVTMPVVVENDATAAVIAEHWSSSADQTGSFVAIYVGTGIGAGVVMDNRVVRGVSGNAGEAGHIVVESNGRACFCGNRGCVEAYASPSAIVQHYRERTTRDPAEGFSYVDLCRLATGGDQAAMRSLHQGIAWLADAAVSLVNVLDVNELVLCGKSLHTVENVYAEIIDHAVNTRTIGRTLRPVNVRISGLGELVGATGAACLILDTHYAPRFSAT